MNVMCCSIQSIKGGKNGRFSARVGIAGSRDVRLVTVCPEVRRVSSFGIGQGYLESIPGRGLFSHDFMKDKH